MNETLFAQLCNLWLSLLVIRKGHVHLDGFSQVENTDSSLLIVQIFMEYERESSESF